MISYNERNNHKNSRKIELMFKEYYEEQNALQLVDLNTINQYSLYDFRDDKNKIFIEVRHRREYNRNDLSYMLFNKDKLNNLYQLQRDNKYYKIYHYQYIYNDEDGMDNYKLYIIDLEDLQGLNLHTTTDNQGKTCYKIPLEYYNKLKDYPPILNPPSGVDASSGLNK
jgi:hypothetical protein